MLFPESINEHLNSNDQPQIVKNNELPFDTKIKLASEFKDEGVKLFADKKFAEAIFKFKKGLELLYGEGLKKEASDLMMSLNLNICNCFNNLKAYDMTIDRTEFSLKLRKDHPKIYYYRGIAYINLGKVEEAEKDYDRLYELIPTDDPGLLNLRRLIDEKLPKPDTKVFKSFFKTSLYDDVDVANKKKSSDDEDDEEYGKVSDNIFHVYGDKK